MHVYMYALPIRQPFFFFFRTTHAVIEAGLVSFECIYETYEHTKWDSQHPYRCRHYGIVLGSSPRERRINRSFARRISLV